jgi:hypothetical protein
LFDFIAVNERRRQSLQENASSRKVLLDAPTVLPCDSNLNETFTIMIKLDQIEAAVHVHGIPTRLTATRPQQSIRLRSAFFAASTTYTQGWCMSIYIRADEVKITGVKKRFYCFDRRPEFLGKPLTRTGFTASLPIA